MYDDYENDRYSLTRQEQEQQIQQRAAAYLARVMGWMCVGLLTTLASALICVAVPGIAHLLYNQNAIYAVCIAQIGAVIILSTAMRGAGPGAVTVMFMVYAALTGVTASSLMFLFQTGSLIFVFGVAAFIFVSMAVYGLVARRDLSRMGAMAFFGLLGIIMAGLVNLFVGSGMLDFLITSVGIVIFVALTAYDTQKIKAIYLDAVAQGCDEDGPELRKLAIYGALTLYLDFINLFLKLLRLFGQRRD